MLRGQWVATARGEQPVDPNWTPRLPGKSYGKGGLWSALMLYAKKLAVNGTKAVPRPIGASLVPTKVESLVARWKQKDPRANITTDKHGTIRIPGAAVKTKHNAALMKSFDHGQQLCSACMYAQPSDENSVSTDTQMAGSNFDFEFTLESKSSRTAFLVANFSTWHVNQTLQVAVSSSGSVAGAQGGAVQVPVHLTFGYWNRTQPVELRLTEGSNTLRFDRGSSDRAIAIKDFYVYSSRPTLSV